MRNWMFISIAVIVLGGGTTMFVMHRTSTALSPEPLSPQTTSGIFASSNPLLTATHAQLDRWIRPFCGPLWLSDVPPKDNWIQPEPCIQGVIDGVENDIKIKVTSAQVSDPAFKAHVRQVYGAK